MLACAALVLALGLQFVLRTDDAPSATAGGLAPRRPKLAAIPAVPDFAAIQRIPLFTPDRRPAATETGGASADAALGGYALLGVAVGGSAATALVGAPGGTPKALRPGDLLDGWRLIQVGRAEAIFERNGARHSLAVGAPAQVSVRAEDAAGAKDE